MWPDTPLAEQTRPRNACQKSVKQIKFSEMLPVEVFLETSVTMTEFSRLFQWKHILLLTKSQEQNPAHGAAYTSHNGGRCGFWVGV